MTVLNTNLFYSYNVISNLLMKFELIIKHEKIEVFHVSRLQGNFNLSPLNLISLGELVLCLKIT